MAEEIEFLRIDATHLIPLWKLRTEFRETEEEYEVEDLVNRAIAVLDGIAHLANKELFRQAEEDNLINYKCVIDGDRAYLAYSYYKFTKEEEEDSKKYILQEPEDTKIFRGIYRLFKNDKEIASVDADNMSQAIELFDDVLPLEKRRKWEIITPEEHVIKTKRITWKIIAPKSPSPTTETNE